MEATLFCVPGGHTGPTVTPPPDPSFTTNMPRGWYCVHARVKPGDHTWYLDPDGPARIVVCSDHLAIVG